MRKLAMVSFSLSAAVFLANFVLPEELWLPLGGGLALLCLPVWLLQSGKKRTRLALALVLTGLSAGFLWIWGYTRVFYQPAREMDGRTLRLCGVVADWPGETDYGYRVLVEADTENWRRVTTLLYTDGQGAGLRPGDHIETIAHFRLASRSAAGEEITYYTAKGILLVGQAYGRLNSQRPERVSPGLWPALLSRRLKQGIDAAFSPKDAPLVQALVTGNRDHLTDEFTTSLQRTGLTHATAVSGMHLAFLAGLLSLLLGRGSLRTALVMIPTVLLFAAVAGNTPSVVRAAVLIILLQLAPLFGRERDNATALGTALMMLLLQNPYSAAHVGLQLSFASVAGILLVSDRLQRRLAARMPRTGRKAGLPRGPLSRLGYGAAAGLSATAGAMVLTTPLVMIYFRSVSVIAPLSNLLTLWAVALLFGGGLIVGCVGAVLPGAGAVLALPLTPLARYLEWVVARLARVPFAALTMDSPYYLAWVALVYLFFLAGLAVKGRKRLLLPLCAGALTLGMSIAFTLWTFQLGDMTITALDVGQGQSVLVRSGGYLTLVDCGGDSYRSAGDIAADYLQNLGVGKLDLLVITHFHDDHANGVPQLLRRLRVAELALPDVEEGAELREEIMALAQAQGIRLRLVREDQVVSAGNGCTLRLYPPLGQGETNELGLSLLASAGEMDVLITGDMGSQVEEKLLEHAQLPQVEVLVAGHHGSRYAASQALLSALRPRLALISVGENNHYGHPDQQTLERLAEAGADIYRTDLHGTITVRCRSRELHIQAG